MHGFCGRGIGKEGYGQQRECTDCQKITPGDKTGSLSSPMELDAVLSEEEGGGSRPESCITSSITEFEAEVHSRFEEIRSYLYAEGRGGEYSETQYLLSKAVNLFTHKTQVKRRGKERGEVQATVFAIYGRGSAFLAHNHCCCATKQSTCSFWNSHVVTASL